MADEDALDNGRRVRASLKRSRPCSQKQAGCRTASAEAPEISTWPVESLLIEKEPVTVICSQKG